MGMITPLLYSIIVILRRKASKDLNPLCLLPSLNRLRFLVALGMTKQRPGMMVGVHLVGLRDNNDVVYTFILYLFTAIS